MCRFIHFYFLTLLIFELVQVNNSVSRTSRSQENKNTIHDDNVLTRVSTLMSDDTYFKQALESINIPRVVGSPNHTAVFEFITSELERLGWHVDVDQFVERTPLGMKSFKNIVATLNKNADRYLDLACHYDSKLFYNSVFYGTTDSAVPCAMMLQIASSLNDYLKKNRNDELALRFIFFDGEEAFVHWSAEDSLYGSRHLAQMWASTPHVKGDPRKTELDRIDLFVLLDLLGAPNPKFYLFHSKSLEAYKMLVNAQTRLRQKGHILSNVGYFNKKSTSDSIEDDHIPFLLRGVRVLHIIPLPFPRQWHTQHDDYTAIDMSTINNLVKIFTVFVADYLGLDLS